VIHSIVLVDNKGQTTISLNSFDEETLAETVNKYMASIKPQVTDRLSMSQLPMKGKGCISPHDEIGSI
jgi:hypothetical protein